MGYNSVWSFPDTLEPFCLCPFQADLMACLDTYNPQRGLTLSLGDVGNSGTLPKLAKLLGASIQVATSPACKVTLEEYSRALAGIPKDAAAFCFVYPFEAHSWHPGLLRAAGFSDKDMSSTLVQLLQRGGFCYSDCNNKVLKVNAVISKQLEHEHGQAYLQFNKRTSLTAAAAKGIRNERFKQTPRRYAKEANTFAWFNPHEIVGEMNVGGEHGAFVFKVDLQGSQYARFEVLNA